MAEIRFDRVTKAFGENRIVQALDLVINDGEFFTFVGPSGCGKSTILNLIAGLEEPTSGVLLFDGVAVNKLSPRERDVAMVFQSYALYPHMTVFENIAFPLEMKKTKKETIAAEVRRAATLLGISDLLSRKPGELSGGQRQRVALGRALVRKPKVFLLDEPLSNLDARLRIDMRAELKLLHQQLGITMVYVTHDQGEAMGLSDRLAVLDKGIIQQCDSPGEVYQNPANRFVAGFIGSPPMNFVRCKSVGRDSREVDCNGLLIGIPHAAGPEPMQMVLGIRPDDLLVEQGKRESGIEVTVSVIEPAGSFNWVEVLWNGSRLRGKALPEERLQPGSSAFLTFSREKVLLFDEATGKRV